MTVPRLSWAASGRWYEDPGGTHVAVPLARIESAEMWEQVQHHVGVAILEAVDGRLLSAARDTAVKRIIALFGEAKEET